MIYWIILSMAIIIESIGLTFMKTANGLSKFYPSLYMFICYIICLCLLTIAVKKIDLGLAYAIWSGVGTALICIIGIIFFNEIYTLYKLIGLLMIIIGILLLKY